MFKYGKTSMARLETCDERIRMVWHEMMRLQVYDIGVIEGARSDKRQAELYRLGQSQLDGVERRSNHQVDDVDPLSRAIDSGFYPYEWSDSYRWCMFAGFAIAIGRSNGIKLRSGVDWSMNFNEGNYKTSLFDGPHLEIV